MNQGWRRRISIKQKLWGVGALAVLVFVLLGTLAFNRLGNMESLARQVSSAHQVEGAIADAYEGWLLDDDQSNMYAAVIALRDKTQHDLAETTYQQAVDGYHQAVDELAKARGLVSTDTERSALDTISSTLASYNKFTDEMRKRALAGNVDGTVKVMTVENLEPSNALPDLFQKLRELETTRADALQHRMRSDATSGKTLIIITALLGLLILGAAITMLVRAITRPLTSVVGALEAVAGGDLTVRLEHRNADEIGRIATALNSAAESLQVAQDDVARAQTERENLLAEEARVAAERAEADRARAEEESRRQAADAEREQQRVRAEAEREQTRVREEAEREQARLAEQHAAERATAEAKQAEADELSRKVDALLQVVDATAAGDFTRPVTVSGSDAIGRLGSGLDSLLQTLRSSMSDIGSMSAQLARAAEELTGVSGELGDEAARTTQRAATVASASDEVAASIETMASSATEMTASINEIARNATDAARVAADAVIASTRARQMVTALGVSSEEISGIVDVITSIAKQTNLLALNAHIESARAGEAGRGFAVVASEVKGLAQETERASLDVSQKIAALQSGTRGASEAIGDIGVHVDRINATQATIATAVEEQTATTSEIARHVGQASSAASAISVDVGQVATAAQSSQQGAQSALTAAHHVSGLATQLNDLLGRFRY